MTHSPKHAPVRPASNVVAPLTGPGTPGQRFIPAAPVLPLPWWRVGAMWVLVGGLGVVVIGSFMLLGTALEHADTVLPQSVAATHAVPNTAASPALAARNHAATPAR